MKKKTSLKDLRIKSGLKAYKVAEQLGIGYKQLYRLERGHSKLDKLKEEKLSQIYNVPISLIKDAWKWGVSKDENKKSNNSG